MGLGNSTTFKESNISLLSSPESPCDDPRRDRDAPSTSTNQEPLTRLNENTRDSRPKAKEIVPGVENYAFEDFRTKIKSKHYRHCEKTLRSLKFFSGPFASHGFVVTSLGRVMCFGRNDTFQLGVNDAKNRLVPTIHEYLTPSNNVSNIAVSEFHSLVLSNGVALSCGSDSDGCTGLKKTEEAYTKVPTRIPIDESKVLKIACGNRSSFFVCSSGKVFACGSNTSGILGIGSEQSTCDTPTTVKFDPSVSISSISACSTFTLFLSSLGWVFICGDGLAVREKSNVPVLCMKKFVVNDRVLGIRKIASGDSHALFLTAEGTVYVYGHNTRGQCGTGDNRLFEYYRQNTSRNTIDVVCGFQSSYYLSKYGGIFSSGSNKFGELGITSLGFLGRNVGGNHYHVVDLGTVDYFKKRAGGRIIGLHTGKNCLYVVTSDFEIHAAGNGTFGNLMKPGTGFIANALQNVGDAVMRIVKTDYLVTGARNQRLSFVMKKMGGGYHGDSILVLCSGLLVF